MPATEPQPALYVVACGAYPARQLAPFAGAAQRQGWDVCVIATPDGLKFTEDSASSADGTSATVSGHSSAS